MRFSKDFFFTSLPVRDVHCIDFGGQDGIFFVPLFLLPLLFYFRPSLFGALNALKTMRKDRFLSPGLWFFNFRLIYRAAIALTGSGIGWQGTPRTILICFTSSKARSECCFGLVVNSFLY